MHTVAFFLCCLIMTLAPAANGSTSLKLFFSNIERATLLNSTEPYVVTGYVSNSSNITQLTINNEAVSLDEAGNFSYTLLPRQGENLIAATAKNEKGDTVFSTRSLYQSNAWLGFDESLNKTHSLKTAITTNIDHSIFEEIISTLKERFSLKRAIQSVFADVNMSSFADQPIFSANGYFAQGSSQYQVDVFLRSLNILNPDADAQLINNGVHINGTLSNQGGLPGFTVVLYVKAVLLLFNKLSCPVGNFYVTYSADSIEFATDISISKTSDLPLNATMQNFVLTEDSGRFTTKILPFEINSFFQPWQWLFPVAFDDWFTWIITEAVQANSGKILSLCNDVLRNKTLRASSSAFAQISPFCSFDISLSTDSFDWASYHPEINMHAELDTLAINANNINATFNASMQSNQNQNHIAKQVYLRDDCGQNIYPSNIPSDNFRSPIQSAFKIDFINQIFHALWWGGLFDITQHIDTTEIPDHAGTHIKNVTVTAHPLLPPIINDCNQTDFHMQAGDIEVFISFQFLGENVTIHAFTSAIATALFQGDGDNIRMLINAPIFKSFDIIEAKGLSLINLNLLNNLFDDYLLPLFEKKYASNELFSLPIPPIPLHQIFRWLTKDDDISFHDLTVNYQPGQLQLGAYAH